MFFKFKQFFNFYQEKIKTNRYVVNITRYIELYSEQALSDAAAAMSYYMLFALVPLIILILIWISFITEAFSFLQNLNFNFNQLMPEVVVEYLAPIVRGVLINQNTSFLSLGVLSLFWASSRGFDYFWGKLQTIFGVSPTTYIVRRLLGIVFIALLAISIFVLLIFVAFSHHILDLIHLFSPLTLTDAVTYNIVTLFIPSIFLSLVLSLIYYMASRRKYPFYHSLIVSIVPVSMWFISSFGLRFYINQFSKFDILYGGITSIVVLMFWLYLLFFSIFLGAFIQESLLSREKKS